MSDKRNLTFKWNVQQKVPHKGGTQCAIVLLQVTQEREVFDRKREQEQENKYKESMFQGHRVFQCNIPLFMI